MAQPFPLPKETRSTAVLAFNPAQLTYGPFPFKIFDLADVTVLRRRPSEDRFVLVNVTVAKVAGLNHDFFTIAFAAPEPDGTMFVVIGKRLHERTEGLAKGQGLSVNALEKELSKQGVILQELRRDIDERAILSDPGIDPVRLIEDPIEGHLAIFGPDNSIINTEKTLLELSDQLQAEQAAAAAAASAAAAATSASDAAASAVSAEASAQSADQSADDAAASAAAAASASDGFVITAGAPRETIYDYNGGVAVVHVIGPDVRFFQVLGVGGGANGQTVQQNSNNDGTYRAGGAGGASGHYGETEIFANPGGSHDLTINVGKGGVPEIPDAFVQLEPATQSDVQCPTLGFGPYIFRPGMPQSDLPSAGPISNPSLFREIPELPLYTADNANGKRLKFTTQAYGEPGTRGLSRWGSRGGSSPWGRGGAGNFAADGSVVNGGVAYGYGSGGGGGAIHGNSPTNYGWGGSGTQGRIVVREWYVP
jgi:hypothetical protein